MAAEIEPPDTLIPSVPPPPPLPPPLDHPNPPKRQRRPSVRLGEIGGESRPNKTWRFHKDPSLAAKTSKTRPLTNLVNGEDSNNNKPKSKKLTTKRARTNWNKFDEENEEEDFREFEEGSESPLNSVENAAAWGQRRSNENDEGVREWLIGLGLGRYTPVFEIHEVDDEVLPLLTLDDLKDMGITAVGSRRKLYNAILNLRKPFS